MSARPPRRQPRRFQRPRDQLTIEQKIEAFVLRNSDNGYFTKMSTISAKFGLPEDRTWGVIGELLVDGNVESVHGHTGEMKLCRAGKTYELLGSGQRRRRPAGGGPDRRRGPGGRAGGRGPGGGAPRRRPAGGRRE